MTVSKTYFVLTNFDLTPNGPIKLGSIIADPLDPEDALNLGGVVEIPEHQVHTNHKRDWDITESLNNGQFSVTAQFISSLNLDGAYGTDLDLGKTSHFSIQDVETLDFSPTQSYIDEVINNYSVRGFLEGVQYKLPVYMVTGLKIGRRLSERPSQVSNAGSSSTQPDHSKHAFQRGNPDFVIAYRLLKISVSEGEAQGVVGKHESKDGTLGKMLGDDDKRDTDFGALKTTLTANIDGGREVAAHEIIGGKSIPAIDEDGNKECMCIIVPPFQPGG